MGMYHKFMLKEDCFLVKGAKRGAIYDLKSGEVYSIDSDACKVIELCEAEISLQTLLKKPDFCSRKDEIVSYLQELKIAGLGRFLNEDEQIQKIRLKRYQDKLDFIWLEITNRCNLRCIHCYSDSSPISVSEEKMGFTDWIRAMQEAYEIGCRKLQFIGGEPFLMGDILLELAKHSHKIGYEFVEIFTNGTCINEKQIDFLSKNNIAIALSLYGPNPSVHDKITLKRGSFHKTLENLKRLKRKELKIRVAIIGMAENQDYAGETISFLKKEIGIEQIGYDVVRPIGRGWPEVTERHQVIKPRFPKCTLTRFQRMKYGHNCFSKQLCITASGKVIPCIMERETELGNILNQKLREIWYSNKTKRIRNLNKDFIKICKDCEYRYACFDCRPKAKMMSSDGDIYAKPAECQYNPYTGE